MPVIMVQCKLLCELGLKNVTCTILTVGEVTGCSMTVV